MLSKSMKKLSMRTFMVTTLVVFMLMSKKSDVYSKEIDSKRSLYSGISKATYEILCDEFSKELSTEYNKISYTMMSRQYLDGWTTTRVNVRKEPSIDSEVLYVEPFNNHISYIVYNDEWIEIVYSYTNDQGLNIEIPAYINSKYISNSECSYTEYNVPDNKGFKSYMSYRAISSVSSPQYKLQSNYAYTGNYGIRQIDSRYCVAIGTAFNASVGTYVDLILNNGSVIPCVVSDIKANKDTDSNNIITVHNGCVSEFLVETTSLPSSVTTHGDISYCQSDWNSKVVKIRVYNKSVL